MGYMDIIYEEWENAKTAKEELNGKRIRGREMKVEWMFRDRDRMIKEGKSDFGIEKNERARRSLVVTGIVGNSLHSRVLIQNELVKQGIWKQGMDWQPEEVRNLGQREENRSILIVCRSK